MRERQLHHASDSCGKAGDPHNLESLAACPGHIATKRRRALDGDVAAQEAGDSQAPPSALAEHAPAACRAWPTPSISGAARWVNNGLVLWFNTQCPLTLKQPG